MTAITRGQASGLYKPQPFLGNPDNEREIFNYISRELANISAAFEFALIRNVEFLNVAPTKLREGMIRGADGVNWNPGSGKGVYCYYSGAWHLLG